MKITIELTDAQEREFTACATVAGISLDQWIAECAAVKAASVIDALQAPLRAERVSSKNSNSAINYRKSFNRKKRSAVMEAAQAYNAKFR